MAHSEGGGGHGDGGGERWLITYADLITLMMVFFVVLYSMANVDAKKYAKLAGVLSRAFNQGNSAVPLPLPNPGAGGAAPAGPAPAPDALERLGQELQQHLGSRGEFQVYVSRRGLVLSLLGSALFEQGQATIRPQARALLDQIAARLRALPNDISVEGSADNQPISSAEFPSNWELSAGRATEVVRYFTDGHGLDPQRFLVVGYGEHRPVADNASADGRALNRRVDVVVLREHLVVELGVPVR